MIQINLLPIRARKKKENIRQLMSIYFLSVFLLVAAMGYVWLHERREIAALSARFSNLEQEVKKLSTYDTMLADLKKRKEMAESERNIIKELQADRDAIVRILTLLSIKVPVEKMWFEKVVQNAGNMTLDGVAQSNEAIAEFMRNLESSPFVEKGTVSLTHSRQVSMKDMKLREFQVAYRFLTFTKVQEQLKAQATKAKGT